MADRTTRAGRLTGSLATMLVVGVAAAAAPAAEDFSDSFENGKAALEWRAPPVSSEAVLEAKQADDAPDDDGGIGILRHPGGRFASISYADTPKAEDSFQVEAWLDCPIEAQGRDGTLTGLAFFVLGSVEGDDPDAGGFYRLVCDYRLGNAALSLAYVGANIGRQPIELERWPLVEQTIAPASRDGWHQVQIDVNRGLIDLYLGDAKLNERSIPAERAITDIANVDAGYAGVYAGHIGESGTAEARVDGFRYTIP